MANNDHLYQYDVPGFLFINPLVVLVRAVFSSNGAVVTVSTTRRQSHPGATIAGSAGDYTVSGLPTGRDYHPVGVLLAPGDGTADVNQATVKSFNASNGTLAFQTRATSDGDEAAPPNDAQVFITLLVDQGVSD